jgi:ABC-type sulfate transport system permease component
MKTKRVALSRTYIDADGNIVRKHNLIEKMGNTLLAIFSGLPFMVSFILCSLLLIEGLCFAGLISACMNPESSRSDIGVYFFLCIVICLMCLFGFGTGWYLTRDRQMERRKQNPQHPQSSQGNSEVGYSNY